jgi:hypothetical protein
MVRVRVRVRVRGKFACQFQKATALQEMRTVALAIRIDLHCKLVAPIKLSVFNLSQRSSRASSIRVLSADGVMQI